MDSAVEVQSKWNSGGKGVLLLQWAAAEMALDGGSTLTLNCMNLLENAQESEAVLSCHKANKTDYVMRNAAEVVGAILRRARNQLYSMFSTQNAALELE